MALVPDGVAALVRDGCDVLVERGAGSGFDLEDDAYAAAGASMVGPGETGEADLVVSVGNLADGFVARRGDTGSPLVFVGVFDPLWMPERAERHAADGTTAFSMDLVPRITRAQTMDVLSSMGTIAGYEAVLLAAGRLPQMFPLMMTAAGTLAPARVLVLGAGVAGLQAIATSRRLGAVVEAYDVRPAAVEQIRSMGARAVELDLSEEGGDAADAEDVGGYARAQSELAADRQRELLAPHVAEADVVITTAAIPGRASPLLVTAEMVEAMAPGSIVIDLASERGGNCALTRPGEEVTRNGVTVLGPTDLVSRCARHASQMFSRNLVTFLGHLAPEGAVDVRLEDEIISAMLVSHGGAVVHPGVAAALGAETDTDDAADGAAESAEEG